METLRISYIDLCGFSLLWKNSPLFLSGRGIISFYTFFHSFFSILFYLHLSPTLPSGSGRGSKGIEGVGVLCEQSFTFPYYYRHPRLFNQKSVIFCSLSVKHRATPSFPLQPRFFPWNFSKSERVLRTSDIWLFTKIYGRFKFVNRKPLPGREVAP